jgi:acyl transferase domain-containing protein
MIDDIAIVGIGLKVAECTSFWDYYLKLQKKESLYQTIEGKRLTDLHDYLKKVHKSMKEIPRRRHCFLKNIDQFDYSTFHISPKEAAYMDPNQRLMLETVYSAFIDSGISINKGSNTSVFIGYRENKDYLELIENFDPEMLSFALPGNLSAAIAGRISYTFDWKGNCMLMDSGDSSSLLALQSACDSISRKEADIAVAGGIDLHILPFERKKREETFELKEKGECVAAVVLKPLSDAIKDKNPIFGVIKSCISNRSSTHESLFQKEKLLTACLQNIDSKVNRLNLVELSGTADTQEKEVVKRLLSKYPLNANKEPVIDTLSDDIDNLEVSSGLMGLMKALFCLDNHIDDVNQLDIKDMILLAHFGKDGGNTCAILEKSEEYIGERKELLEGKRKQTLIGSRCWINN